MIQYKKPDGTLVLDFLPEPKTLLSGVISVLRKTRSSRKPGGFNTGVTRHAAASLRVCEDCGSKIRGETLPGEHAPHSRDGKLVNCVGREIEK